MLPGEADPGWAKVLTRPGDLSTACLATRLLVTRLRADVARDPKALRASIATLRTFFVTNKLAAKDVALVVGGS
jgi:hypothetical protein